MLKTNKQLSITKIIYLVIFIFLSIFLFSLLKNFNQSLDLLKNSNKYLDTFVLLLSLASFPVTAISIYKLSFTKLNYSRTVLIQFAANTLNRILPAGIGALGVIYDYLVRSKNSKSQAISVVGINNFIGFISGVITFVIFILTFNFTFKGNIKYFNLLILVVGIIIFILVLLVIYFSKLRTKFISFVKRVLLDIRSYRKRPSDLFISLFSQIGLNLLNIFSLYIIVHALHLNVGLAVVALSYNFAILFGGLIPAPGGVGSVDAGLVGALIFFGTNSTQALTITILFRLLNMWAPFFLGLPALFYARNKKYI